jgi:hypothetical protein
MGKKIDTEEMGKFAPTTWGQPKQDKPPYEYETPSGQLCLIRKIGMEEILDMGLFNELDFFSKAMATTDKNKPKTAEEMDDSFATKVLKNFGSMKETINKVLLVGVIAPVLMPVPAKESDRVSGTIYVDSVPFEDAFDLFGEIVDSEGLSTFRKEPEVSVGNLPDEQVLQGATE